MSGSRRAAAAVLVLGIAVRVAGDEADDAKKKPFELYWKEGQTVFRTDDFQLGLSNRIQFRFERLTPENDTRIPGTAQPGDSISTFKIRRAKTQLEGWFWKREIQFELQIGWAGSDATGGSATFSGLEDALLNWDASKSGAFMVQVGQFKVPFGRQELTSSERQQFVDRSILSGEFTRSRDVGVQVWGRVASDKLEYRAGVFNGNGRNRPINDNDKLQYDARLTFEPFGPVGYSESDFESKDRPLVALALEFEDNDNARATSAPPGGFVANFHDTTFGADVVLKYRGFSAYGELFLRERDPEQGESFDSDGYVIQSGCFLKRDVFELAFRYASWDPSDATPGDDQTEIGGAANYYFLKHRLKLQADYRSVDDDAQDRNLKELRFQLQFVF
ncbi:MAG TPA: porin [Vicinamibacteria bacterium]|nr:porin [Vicinamibacteria bacterium]